MNIKNVPAHPTNYTATSHKKVGFVIHWMVGTLESTDAHFQKPNAGASAHYGIGDEEIHKYVPDAYYAWHAGNGEANRKYIGIELEGGWLQNGSRVKPSQKTHETCAKLMAELCRIHGIDRVDHKINLFRHNEVSDQYTECSGSTDIQLIQNLTNQLLQPTMDDELKNVTEWMKAVERKYGIKIMNYDDLSDTPITRSELARVIHRFKDYIQVSPNV